MGFDFCYLFIMSVTYDFDTIFLLGSPEVLLCFRCRLFCNKDFFRNHLSKL